MGLVANYLVGLLESECGTADIKGQRETIWQQRPERIVNDDTILPLMPVMQKSTALLLVEGKPGRATGTCNEANKQCALSS